MQPSGRNPRLVQDLSGACVVVRPVLSLWYPPLEGYQWWAVGLISTAFTSIWTILILLSTTVLKLLAPLQRFTAWFFNLEKHPVQAIGIVAAALVMLGSLVWKVLRAVV